jgi:hypothetical protein
VDPGRTLLGCYSWLPSSIGVWYQRGAHCSVSWSAGHRSVQGTPDLKKFRERYWCFTGGERDIWTWDFYIW